MEILNTHPKCKGLWTREEKGSKSVLDYVLVNKEHQESVEEVIIDEEKVITPYTKGNSVDERTYTDHNTITIKLNWIITSMVEKRERVILNDRSKANFKQATENGELTDIWNGMAPCKRSMTYGIGSSTFLNRDNRRNQRKY